MLREYDVVRLLRAVPGSGLEPGAVGAVVIVYPEADAYEVEFVDREGATIALLTLEGSWLENVPDDSRP